MDIEDSGRRMGRTEEKYKQNEDRRRESSKDVSKDNKDRRKETHEEEPKEMTTKGDKDHWRGGDDGRKGGTGGVRMELRSVEVLDYENPEHRKGFRFRVEVTDRVS